MTTYTRLAPLAFTLSLALAACGGGGGGGGAGGGGGGGGGGTPTVGIALPSEISALPATSAGAASSAPRALTALPGGDYAAAQTTKAVNERALSQFDILNTIFSAIAQTHYADAENVNAGPYAAIVSWVDDGGDRVDKRLVRWVVDSRMQQVDGKGVNRIQIWFFDVQDGQQRLIRVGMDVFEAPTRNADGSYSDYGVWTIDARLGATAAQYFAASADRVLVDGQSMSRVMMHEVDKDGTATRGILLRAQGRGWGKVSYPDWSCTGSGPCTPTQVEVAYVYDADNVALQKSGQDPMWKSRTASVDVVNRYGVYDATTGTDVTRTFKFGFPIRYSSQGGVEQYGYYGAWQGRHQIFTGGSGSIAPNTPVLRGDRDTSTTTFVTSPIFDGVLTQRSHAPSTLSEITDVVLGTWLGQGARVKLSGGVWTECVDPQWTGGADPVCAQTNTAADPTPFFTAQAPEQLNLNAWSQGGGSQNLVYASGQLYVASPGPNGTWISSGTPWPVADGSEVWAWRNGPAWLVYDGAGWEQKAVLHYDPQTNTPVFDVPEKDTGFTFVPDRDYNLNQNGVNYVVRYSGGAYDIQIERQTVPNPLDAATMIPDSLRFQRSCCGDTSSTFAFVTDSTQPDYLQLVYDHVGPQDQAAGHLAGATVQEGIWNLVGTDGKAYSWNYPSGNDTWAVQQYLLLDGQYQVLDDPLQFAPTTLAGAAGHSRSYALQFDGSWLGGLPDVQQLLRNDGGDMTEAIAAQVVNVPEGQLVTDAHTHQPYVFKPLQIQQFLLPVADPGNLLLDPATALHLTDVPGYVDAGLGDPPDVPVRYSQGLPVQ